MVVGNMMFIILALLFFTACSAQTPVVLWHGMGDSCCNPQSMGYIKDLIERNVHGVYVKSVKIGSNVAEDIENSFFMNANKQIDIVCKQINQDKKLTNGYNAIGFSQGGQFWRAIAQKCPTPPMINLVSVGGQHQGIYGFPTCPGDNYTICNYVNSLLNFGAYISFVQNHLVPAQYWHDPLNEAEYRSKSVFLADINQEKSFNQTYKTNLLKIKNLVLVKFLKDTMVDPKESEWFGFYKPGQTKDLYKMTESPLFQKDYLGLETLHNSGRITFLASDGDHLQFTDEWFIKNIVKPFLM